MTAQTLILAAYRLIGVLRPGQTAGTDKLNEGLSMLNDMLDQWSVQRLAVPVIVRHVLDVVASQQTYTIGTGGNWNVARPVRIERAGVVMNGTERPIRVLSAQGWAEIAQKSTASTIPEQLYYDGAYPLGNISLWPVPSDAAVDVALYAWQPVVQFADLATTNYDFPPGYPLALRSNLAALLIPQNVIQNKSNQSQMSLVLDQARTTLGWLKQLAAPNLELRSEISGGRFDIYRGDYV